MTFAKPLTLTVLLLAPAAQALTPEGATSTPMLQPDLTPKLQMSAPTEIFDTLLGERYRGFSCPEKGLGCDLAPNGNPVNVIIPIKGSPSRV